MSLEQLKDALKAVGCLLVQVERPDHEDESLDIEVKGTIDDYIAAVAALRAPVVLVQTDVLEESEFHYSPDNNEDEDEDESVRSAPIDLCSINPRLSEFKRYIGEVGALSLMTLMQSRSLSYVLQEDWHREFVSHWQAAADEVEDRHAAELASAQERIDVESRKLLNRLHGLVDDHRFTRMPTQKAMMQFALKHIPELDQLSKDVLKSEVQELVAKIQAQSSE